MRNLRLAFRTLSRTPFVTGIAVLSLALGIGANAAIFSLFEQMMLRSLPVHEPDLLVNLTSPGPKQGTTSCSMAGDCSAAFSYPMFRDLEAVRAGLSGLAAHRSFKANISLRDHTTPGTGMFVSGSYFPVLGLRPALGRLLGPADDETIGGHPVAVLSHAYWETQLGSDPSVIGETVTVNGQPLTIVGVAPRGFEGTTMWVRPIVFVPITMRGVLQPWFKGFDDRTNYWVYVFGRLASGATLEQASTAINAVYRPIIAEVETPLQRGMSAPMLEAFRARTVTLETGSRGQSIVHHQARAPLILLFAVTGIVLLIACANIANLLLARGAARNKEMAVRLSLGASRRLLMAQLLTESLLLAALGGAASLLVAQWTLAFVASMFPPGPAAAVEVALRPGAILFTAVVALGTGLLFGIYPALHGVRTDLVRTVLANADQHTGARGATQFRNSLATAQIALAVALLASAGLFLGSLVNLVRADLGMRVDHLVTFTISPELNGYAPDRQRNLYERVEEELAAIPGVTSVAASFVPLFAGSSWGSTIAVEGFERVPGADDQSYYNMVGPGFFQTLGVPLITGREFTPADIEGAPKVAIVNEAFARKFGLGADAVGKWMAIGGTTTLDIQIVGLVRDTKYDSVRADERPIFYLPYRQGRNVGQLAFYIRTSGDPTQLLRTIPGLMRRLDPDLPVESLKTLEQQIRESVFQDRTIGLLSTAAAALATLLAAIGLYGVLAYSVAQRTREFGVRMALGADGRRLRAMVLRQVATLVAIGAAIGLPAALGIGRAAGSLLFGLTGHDPVIMVTATAVIALVAMVAGLVPAVRASRVDPVQALRG